MAVEDVIRLFASNPIYHRRVVHTEIIEPRSPCYGTLDSPLSDAIISSLDQNGIRLYTHQCDAINIVNS